MRLKGVWFAGALVALAMWNNVGRAAVADNTPPTITAATTTAANANGWYRANVRVKFICADTGGSGVAYCPPAVTVSTEGAGQVISGTARDKAGNVATASVTLNIDKTAPVVTGARATLADPTGWVTTPVTVSFEATDALSGLVDGSVTPPVTLRTDRTNGSVVGKATDLAGNIGKFTVTDINIDRTAPRITVTLLPAVSGGGYRNAPVTAHFTCTDGRSGVVSCPPDQVFENDGAKQVVTGSTTDVAGNTATVAKTVSIDRTAPIVNATFTPAPNAQGWNTTAVKVKFVCSDATSGVRTCPAARTLLTEGADQVLDVTAVDRAGNTATPPQRVSIDLTAPTLTVTSPANLSTVETPTITVSGTATDAGSGIASVTVNGQPATISGDAFTLQGLTLSEGANGVTVVTTDRVGRTATQSLSVTFAPPPPPASNILQLVEDPRFETGVSNFFAQDASSSVARSTETPLEGTASLRVAITGYGNNLWWGAGFAGGRASHFAVSAHLRSDANSASTLQFCAMVYFADGGTDTQCSPVSAALPAGSSGDKGQVSAELTLDPARALESVRIRMYQEGSDPVAFTIDNALAELDVVEMPPPGGGDTGGGGDGGGSGGGGGGSSACIAPSPNPYPGFTYNLPVSRPFIALTQYDAVNQSTPTFARFRSAVDQAVAGNPPYGYTAQNSVVMYRLTANPVYINDAIARVDAFVTQMESAIAAGETPAIAGDSYLEIGWYLEALSLTYDYGYDRLSVEQRTRWEALANQAIFNLWHPNDAEWNGVSRPWSGWSICDPGNNYHFSFLKATMLWALATKNTELIEFLQTEKFPALVAYYAALPGGGSREGTGYGTAIRNLFEDFLYWKSATGEDLSALTPHVRETIDYWVNATVPTMDRFAPIGDLSRDSYPSIFDYHENLVHIAALLSSGTPNARRGAWWVAENSLDGVQYQFNLSGDILPLPDQPLAPAGTLYHAAGAGALFTRSAWNDPDASYLAVVAGKYDQSHAHQDQGSFTFFRRDFLAVTSNIWSHSGLHEETSAHNTIRFARADGSTIGQSQSDTLASTMTSTVNGGLTTITADLSNAFWRSTNLVQNWTRTFEYFGHTVRVNDSCTVAPGVSATFQLHVPVQPVLQDDGSIRAGNLVIVPLQALNVTFHSLADSEFSRGYRIEFTNPTGCFFNIELRAQ